MTHRAPLFILGAPRSGTSLLYKVLCLHREAAWISNYVRRAPQLAQLSVLNRLPRALPGISRRVWFGEESNAYVYGARRSALYRVAPMPTEGETVFRHCGLPEDPGAVTVPERQRNHAIVGCFDTIQRWGGGSVLVSKRIGHNRRVPLLHAAFPQARFVNLVRDGRAVALSLTKVDWWADLDVWWYGATPSRWAAEGGDPLELAARHWVEEVHTVDAGLGAVPPAQVLTLSYEALVADPLPTLERIRSFAGLPTDRDWSARLTELRFPNRNDRWAQELDELARKRVETVQGEDLARYGYPC